MKRSIAKLTMSGPSGGGGISKDQVMQIMFNISGGSTENGIGEIALMALTPPTGNNTSGRAD